MIRINLTMLFRTFAIGCILFANARAEETVPVNDPILSALIDEMERSMTLKLEDLESPYFVQYRVEDSVNHQINASSGAILNTSQNHRRNLGAQVRVGSYELDNTNFSGGGGRFGRGRFRGGSRSGGGSSSSLPVDNDYLAIRHAIWLATDRSYKRAAETLPQKRAYLEDRTAEERPPDFSVAPPAESIEPVARLELDEDLWRERLRLTSSKVGDHKAIQAADVDLITIAQNEYLVNSEGTRMRAGKIRIVLTITAQTQADDGQRHVDHRTYYVDKIEDIPDQNRILEDVEQMRNSLAAVTAAPILDGYTGPVLFEDVAAAQLFYQLLARGVTATPRSVGSDRRRFSSNDNLDSYLGRRILPRSFQVYDDPTTKAAEDLFLAGSYPHDDEGVAAQRVAIVENGTLKKMITSRRPTKDFTESTGHGRAGGVSSSPRATMGCLFVESTDGLSREELKERLMEEANDQGLDFGLRVVSLTGGGRGNARDRMILYGQTSQGSTKSLADPVVLYKVYVEDGREELVRGCEFGPLSLRTLRDIIAVGRESMPYNCLDMGSAPPSSMFAPSVIIEELDLAKIEQTYDKQLFLKPPNLR